MVGTSVSTIHRGCSQLFAPPRGSPTTGSLGYLSHLQLHQSVHPVLLCHLIPSLAHNDVVVSVVISH